MKWTIIVLLFTVAFAQDVDDEELALAEACDEELCKLPDCRCSSTDIPGGLQPRDTPQFVTVTFDDGVNVINIETYRRILYNRLNPNGCPAGTTFYVNHEYTNYQLINELYNQGYEIALHSVSHQTPQTYWAEATYEDMQREFGDQRIQMAHFANIPIEQLKGIRIPFLQLAGNNSFQVIKDSGLTYDCSWPTISYTNPGLWPYTLDYASIQDCPIPPCPTASIPGVWVQPMVGWLDLNGVACSMVDGCFWVPNRDDEDAWYTFILTNFERHYLSKRAPFGFYIHEWYISAYPGVQRALVRFMNLVNNLDDVFM
ncbi:Chitin deacetylase 5a, partial [Operophtera brumata]